MILMIPDSDPASDWTYVAQAWPAYPTGAGHLVPAPARSGQNLIRIPAPTTWTESFGTTVPGSSSPAYVVGAVVYMKSL